MVTGSFPAHWRMRFPGRLSDKNRRDPVSKVPEQVTHGAALLGEAVLGERDCLVNVHAVSLRDCGCRGANRHHRERARCGGRCRPARRTGVQARRSPGDRRTSGTMTGGPETCRLHAIRHRGFGRDTPELRYSTQRSPTRSHALICPIAPHLSDWSPNARSSGQLPSSRCESISLSTSRFASMLPSPPIP